ncbi:MAG: hypothetical protein C4532_05525 [Candidatus Abyssobacteria bacterium SURF_17]|uniref:Phospholipase C n=1 Tax=Candidatus Abyssobacteria bacterium SURF_17 TaxID=2093361 RepID=A0A419F2R0_9BACT|nr:MAG: hypothetical protein C4532_05525 [Candidatus Abyssubacteria bacterium SURF_17]
MRCAPFTAALTLLFVLQLSAGDAFAVVTTKNALPLHKSEPPMQTHQYITGEAARIWPGTNGQELITQPDWTAFFDGSHHEIWDYIGARTEYYNVPVDNPTIHDGIVTYGGRHAGVVIKSILWTPPTTSRDMPYSQYDASAFNTSDPFADPLDNDDGSQRADGNLTAGSWPWVGNDIIEGAHEEDLFFLHAAFQILYDMYGDAAFNPANDYLQDEFYNGVDYDAAEAFYHHLWRRTSHNDSDIYMMGVSWRNCQSSWDEVGVMPDIYNAHPSPIQIAEGYWQLALDYYLGQNGKVQNQPLAYYFLGRIAHLLADMAVPAHAHCDPHSPVWPDSYEVFMGDTEIYAQYTSNTVPLFDASGNVTGSEPWSYALGDWPYKSFDYVRTQIPGTKWDPSQSNAQIARDKWDSQTDLFHLFWCTAEIADNFDSDSANGEVDNGTVSAGGYTEYELRVIADALMPQAMISLAELYKLFWDAVNVVPPAPPVPDIKANGSDGPITVSPGAPLSITIALDAGDSVGQNADWWVVAQTPRGYFSYRYQTGWRKGIYFYVQTPLADMASTEVWTDLPPHGTGAYTLYFGVDNDADGKLDQTWVDSVSINCTTAPSGARRR